MAVVVHKRQNVQKAGRFSASTFQISASAEAFRILSDGLYSNKIRAIIRELSTNAFDAHVAAGNTDPFHVHLPTSIEPHFSIRDFGIGLAIQVFADDPIMIEDAQSVFTGSYAEVEKFLATREDADRLYVMDEAMSLYTTYFYSNKVHSNDFVGQLGLGSKSPFAYTDSFQVTVYFHGEKRVYNCLLNERKMPEIVQVEALTEETDEHDGVEVSFPVKSGDTYEFHREAQNVYEFFDTIKPVVTGMAGWTHPTREYLFKGENEDWGIRKARTGSKVLMGNIAYPINTNNLYSLPIEYRNLLNVGLEIKMPIGSCEITPSREALSYDPRTIKAISDKVAEVLKDLGDRISDRFTGAATLWEARCLAYDLFFKDGSELRQLAQLANIKEVTWNGQKIDVAYINVADLKGCKVSRYFWEKRQSSWNRSGSKKITKADEIAKLSPEREVVFYECDIPRGAAMRIMYQIKQDAFEKAYLVTFDDAAAKDNFLERMGFEASMLKPASSLPKIVRKRVAEYHSTTETVFIHKGIESAKRLYEYWTPTEVKLDEGGVYLPLVRYKGLDGTREVSPQTIGAILNYMKTLGFTVPKVVAVRPQAVKHFRRNDEWTDFFTWVRHTVKQYCVSADLDRKMANAKELVKLKYFEVWYNLYDLYNFQPDDEYGRFAAFITHLKEMKERCVSNIGQWTELFALIGLTRSESAPRYRVAQEEENILSAYPMLDNWVNRRYTYDRSSSEQFVNACAYINLVDQAPVLSSVPNVNQDVVHKDEDDDTPF